MLVEAFYGWRSGSLALPADAGRNLSDVAGLLLAWSDAAPPFDLGRPLDAAAERALRERLAGLLRTAPTGRSVIDQEQLERRCRAARPTRQAPGVCDAVASPTDALRARIIQHTVDMPISDPRDRFQARDHPVGFGALLQRHRFPRSRRGPQRH